MSNNELIDGIITADKVITFSDKGIINNGGIIIENGLIKEILTENDLINVAKDDVIAHGQFLIPGMIDAHTHMGLYYESFAYEQKDGNESTNPLTPELRAIDAIWPQDTCFEKARKAGITTVCVVPGSANVIGGLGTIIKTAGNNVDEMIVRNPAGLKIALGINPKTVYKNQKKMPSTRMGIMSLLRKSFYEAKEYLEKKNNTKNDDNDDKFNIDLGKENLLLVLSKEIPLRIHCARTDDIYSAFRLQDEFDIDIVLDHAYEVHLNNLPELLSEKKFNGVILGPSFRVKGSSESQLFSFKSAKILFNEGIRSAQMTDHPVIPIEYLPIQAALAQKEGLPWLEALASITINPAKILKIDDKVGSLEKGKHADIALFDGDPLDIRSNNLLTMINGKIVWKNMI